MLAKGYVGGDPRAIDLVEIEPALGWEMRVAAFLLAVTYG